MKHKLYLRLVLCYLVYGAFAFFLLFTFTEWHTTQKVIKNEALSLHQECATIASDYCKAYFNEKMSLDEFYLQMNTLSKYNSSTIQIIDLDGNVLLDSSDITISQAALKNSHYTIKDFSIDSFGDTYYQISKFYNQFNEDCLSVYAPIVITYNVRAYVLIHKPLSAIATVSAGYANITFYTLALFYIVGLIIFVLFTRTIYRPIIKINKCAKAYAKGDFTKKIDLPVNDEIGYLANTLDYMANELYSLEEDQRKFVSNVSHDFRSPLTSIKGYVEAMLDGTIPVEMQDKYLNIILFEAERLNKLTKSLLDLNQFGNHGIRLDIADFDINQIIRTTILTFEGSCQEKNISFDLLLIGKELFVKADMVKIQQVIYNLIDNAIKFSNINSKIKIETNMKNEKVLISIKDSGIGISSENIKKIWDRFYKIDSSRGKDKKGTGLGLAIVKEIITAHQEHINVVSTEGVGTEFLFTLPLSTKEQ